MADDGAGLVLLFRWFRHKPFRAGNLTEAQVLDLIAAVGLRFPRTRGGRRNLLGGWLALTLDKPFYITNRNAYVYGRVYVLTQPTRKFGKIGKTYSGTVYQVLRSPPVREKEDWEYWGEPP